MTVAAAETDIEVDSDEFSSEAEVEGGRAERSFAEILYNDFKKHLPVDNREMFTGFIKETKTILFENVEIVQKMNDQQYFFWLVENYEKFYPNEAAQKKTWWLEIVSATEVNPRIIGNEFGKLLNVFLSTNPNLAETPEFPDTNYYEAFAVTAEATPNQIRKAYRKTVRKVGFECHPDYFTTRLARAKNAADNLLIQTKMEEMRPHFETLTHMKDVLLHPA